MALISTFCNFVEMFIIFLEIGGYLFTKFLGRVQAKGPHKNQILELGVVPNLGVVDGQIFE